MNKSLCCLISKSWQQKRNTYSFSSFTKMVIWTCDKAPQVQGPVLALITCILWVSLPSTPPPTWLRSVGNGRTLFLSTSCSKKENEMKKEKKKSRSPFFISTFRFITIFSRRWLLVSTAIMIFACMILQAANSFCVYSLVWLLLLSCWLSC